MEIVKIASKLLKDCYNKIKEIEDLEFINEEMAECCAYYVKDEDYQPATWDDPGHDEIGHYEGWGEYAIGMVNAILQSIFDNCKDELKGIYKYEYFYQKAMGVFLDCESLVYKKLFSRVLIDHFDIIMDEEELEKFMFENR